MSASKKESWKIQFDDGILKTGLITNAKIAATLCVCYFSKYSDGFPDSIDRSKFISVLARFICLTFHISDGDGSVDVANHIESCLSYVCTKTPIRVIKKKDYIITNTGNRIYIDMSEYGDTLRNVTITSPTLNINSEYEIRHGNEKSELKGLTADSKNFRLKILKKKNKSRNKTILEITIDDEAIHDDTNCSINTENNLEIVLKFEKPTNRDSTKSVSDMDSPELGRTALNQISEGSQESIDCLKIVNIHGSTGPNTVSLKDNIQQYSAFLNNPDFEIKEEFKGWIRLINRFLEPENVFVKFKKDALTISGSLNNEVFHKLYGPVDSPGCFQNFRDSIKHGILSTRFTENLNDSQIRGRIPKGALYPTNNIESFYLDKRLVDTLALAMFLSGTLKVDPKNRHCKIEASRNGFLNMIYEIPDKNEKTNLAIYTESSYEKTVDDMKKILRVDDCDVQDYNSLTLLVPKHERKRICITIWKLKSGIELSCLDSMVEFAENIHGSNSLSSKQWAHAAMDDVEEAFINHLKAIENIHVVSNSDQAESVRLYGFPYSGGNRISAITYAKDIYDAKRIFLKNSRLEDSLCKLVEEELKNSMEKTASRISETVYEEISDEDDTICKPIECFGARYACGNNIDMSDYGSDEAFLKNSRCELLDKSNGRNQLETVEEPLERFVVYESSPASDLPSSIEDFVLPVKAEKILQKILDRM